MTDLQAHALTLSPSSTSSTLKDQSPIQSSRLKDIKQAYAVLNKQSRAADSELSNYLFEKNRSPEHVALKKDICAIIPLGLIPSENFRSIISVSYRLLVRAEVYWEGVEDSTTLFTSSPIPIEIGIGGRTITTKS